MNYNSVRNILSSYRRTGRTNRKELHDGRKHLATNAGGLKRKGPMMVGTGGGLQRESSDRIIRGIDGAEDSKSMNSD